ncbi:MAG: acyltransferase family protein [Steroidobacteraceae bacterium]
MIYRREIDGLRALAVVPVVLFHAGFELFSGGFVGVDVFFVISGYLITTILVNERRSGRFTLVGFYERRARRILPALFLIMALCLPAAWLWLLPADMLGFSQSLVGVVTFASNVLFWLTNRYFDTAADFKPLLHTWSLGVEEQFYVAFPVLLVLLTRASRRGLWWVVASIAVVSLCLAQWASIHKPDAAFYLLPTRAWELMVGSLLALHLLEGQRPFEHRPAFQEFGAALGFALIVYSIFAFDATTPLPGLPALVPTVGAALIIWCANGSTFVGRVLGLPLFVGIGLISYSAYLWHQPMLAFARHAADGTPSPLLMGALAVLTIPLAWLTWRYVELPFRDRRHFTRGQIFAFGAAGSVLFAGIGLVGHFSNGYTYPFRYRNLTRDERELTEATLPSNTAYVDHAFWPLREKSFDASDARPKVLLIGDSYAEDLTNALVESGMIRNLQLSVHYIPHDCGNLFLPQASFVDRMLKDKVGGCEGEGIREDQSVLARMREADEVWFASSWQVWTAELAADSVREAQAFTGKTVRVFGRKHFGDVHIRRLLAMTRAERLATRDPVPNVDHYAPDHIMLRTLPPDVFIDVQDLFCGRDAHFCSPFASDGRLLTFDGTHFTPTGAKLYGERLIERTPLARFAGPAALQR